eukprot:scaffold1867_cov186-Chaetoceros_neogracile.AAC.10
MDLKFTVDQSVEHVQAGEILSGKLIITQKASSKTYKASDLAIYFRGKEYTSVEYTESTGSGKDQSYTTSTAHAKCQIMRVNLNCQTDRIIQHGKLLPGGHTIPFRFQVPTGIPSSMYVSDGRRDSAKIAYCLRAVLKGSGIFQDHQSRLEIKVLAQAQSIRTVPAMIPPRWQKITSWGCIKKGDMTFGVKCMDTQLNPGQKVLLKAAMVNDSMAGIQQIDINLRQITQMQAGSHGHTKCHIASSSRHSQDHHKILDKDSLKISRKNKVSRRQTNIQNLHHILDADDNGQCCELYIPLDVDNTYVGQYITNKHDICVRFSTDSGFTNPEVYIPVNITLASSGFDETSFDPSIPVAEAFPVYPMAAAEPIYDLDENNGSSYALASAPPTNPSYANQLPNTDDSGQTPSLQLLLMKMSQSVDDLSILEHRVLRGDRSEWRAIFANLSPQDYGLILEQVDLTINVVPIATLLASRCETFTCAHVVSVLPHADSNTRTTMVEQLLPYCSDLEENQALIVGMLSDWDQMVIKSVLQAALEKSSRS